jgi:hypothetical protein
MLVRVVATRGGAGVHHHGKGLQQPVSRPRRGQ